MVIKSFFADSVAAAMQEARRQFGEEALLLKTRRTPEEWRSQGAYEVVFGMAGEAGAQDEPSEEASAAGIARFEAQGAKSGLLEAGFSAVVASRLITAAQAAACETADPLGDVAAKMFRADSSFGSPQEPWRIALVGPPGAGKTLTALRLAVIRGIACGRTVRILSACEDRVGGADRMRSYATLLKVQHDLIADADTLKARLQERCDDATLTIVDTPGVCVDKAVRYAAMARVLAETASVQKHLTLPATMNAEDARRTAEAFAPFAFDRLIFSRLDETRSLGPMLSLIASTGKPASFFTTGQDVPGDISPAESLNVRRVLRNCLETAGELAA